MVELFINLMMSRSGYYFLISDRFQITETCTYYLHYRNRTFTKTDKAQSTWQQIENKNPKVYSKFNASRSNVCVGIMQYSLNKHVCVVWIRHNDILFVG